MQKKPTKLKLLLKNSGIEQKELLDMIKQEFPDDPICIDTLSRVMSGSRRDYGIYTLMRISKTLGVTPNEIIDYEEDIEYFMQ